MSCWIQYLVGVSPRHLRGPAPGSLRGSLFRGLTDQVDEGTALPSPWIRNLGMPALFPCCGACGTPRLVRAVRTLYYLETV